MELLYLWVECFRNIKEQEFKFSNEFDITFDLSSKKLEVLKNENPKYSLFDESFINITAIIGRNGSGKSSLFTLIKKIFCDSFYYHDRFFFIVKDANGKLNLFDKYSNGKDIINTSIDKIDQKNFIYDIVDLVYFSNSFSIYEEELKGRYFIDISFNSILTESSIVSNTRLFERYDRSLKQYEEQNAKQDDIIKLKSAISQGYLPEKFIYHFDMQSKIEFVSKYINEEWDFIPGELDISFNQNFFFLNKDVFEKYGLKKDKITDFEFLLFGEQPNYEKKDQQIIQFKNRIILHIFLYIVKHHMFYHGSKNPINGIIEVINSSSNVHEIPKLIQDHFKDFEYSFLKDFLDFIKEIDKEFDSFKYCRLKYGWILTFDITNDLNISLQKIFKFWRDPDFIFSFDWCALSAGESALLTLFSRINYYAKGAFNKVVWILIDEGELYLHPEWQRSFFSDLHTYLPKFFNNKIQLFITSHSPFVISDLPNENIILLNRNDDRLCEVIKKNDFKSTFAANIHTLFSSPFFMDSTCGKFAERRIKQLIKFLESVDKEYVDDEGFKLDEKTSLLLINNIGEDLLKESLINMWKDKFLEQEKRTMNINTALLDKIISLEEENKNLKDDTTRNNLTNI